MVAKTDQNGRIKQPPAVGKSLARLAGVQYGVVSAAQLRQLGLDARAIRRRVAAGQLHVLHGGRVYSVTLASPTSRALYLAAVLALGSRSVLSHRAAADVWGVRPNATRIEVTTACSRRSLPGVTVHRSRVLAPQDVTTRDGIPVTSLARTLLDLAAVVKTPELLNAIDRAERAGLFDLTAVLEVLERAKGRNGARALRQAVAAYRPSTQKSELERRFKQLLQEAADIPSPFFNALVDGESGTHEVDAFWPADRLAVQVDGFAFHRTRRDRERDAASDADLELAGHQVLRLTWDDVNVHGARTLRRVRIARS